MYVRSSVCVCERERSLALLCMGVIGSDVSDYFPFLPAVIFLPSLRFAVLFPLIFPSHANVPTTACTLLPALSAISHFVSLLSIISSLSHLSVMT